MSFKIGLNTVGEYPIDLKELNYAHNSHYRKDACFRTA